MLTFQMSLTSRLGGSCLLEVSNSPLPALLVLAVASRDVPGSSSIFYQGSSKSHVRFLMGIVQRSREGACTNGHAHHAEMEGSSEKEKLLKKRVNYTSSCSTESVERSVSESCSEHENPAVVKLSLNPWNLYMAFRRAKILTVEAVMFLYFFGIYLSGPLFQQYYLNRFSLDVLKNSAYPYVNETHCINKSEVDSFTHGGMYDAVVSHKATNLYIFGNVANRIVAITVTMIMGPLSDRYGRRLPIILVAVGATLQGLLNFAIVHFTLNMYFFILSGVVAGLFGDFSSLLMACYSYISDISSGRCRTIRIGVLEAVQFMAGLLAQGLGGLWFQRLDCDFTYPVLLCVASNVAIVLYTLFYLPESLPTEERRRKNSHKPSGFKLLLRGASIFFCRVREYSVWRLWFSIIPFVIMVVNVTGAMCINVFFFSDLDWGPGLIGAYQATSMGSNMVVLLVILPFLAAIKLPDVLISLIGVIFGCTMNLFLGLSTRTYQVFIGEYSLMLLLAC